MSCLIRIYTACKTNSLIYKTERANSCLAPSDGNMDTVNKTNGMQFYRFLSFSASITNNRIQYTYSTACEKSNLNLLKFTLLFI